MEVVDDMKFFCFFFFCFLFAFFFYFFFFFFFWKNRQAIGFSLGEVFFSQAFVVVPIWHRSIRHIWFRTG